MDKRNPIAQVLDAWARTQSSPTPAFLPTEQFAAVMGLKPDTLRRALCVDGHWCGVRPLKLANKRLMWPLATNGK